MSLHLGVHRLSMSTWPRRGRVSRQCVWVTGAALPYQSWNGRGGERIWEEREERGGDAGGGKGGEKERREEKGRIHKFHSSSLQCWECINSKICSELSLSQRFHRGTSFIKTARGSIRQTYTLCTVDKIISSLWIWLGSSVTWAIATLICDDMSRGERKGIRKRKRVRARARRGSGRERARALTLHFFFFFFLSKTKHCSEWWIMKYSISVPNRAKNQ